MKKTRKKIAIIGGGPAGSATALSLLNTLRDAHNNSGVDVDLDVALYHRKDTQRWPVGETIPPAANTVLRELGVHHLLDSGKHIPCPGSLSVWGSDAAGANDFILDLSGSGFHLDRSQFDRNLLQEVAQRGGRVSSDHTLRYVNKTANGFDLGFLTDQGESHIHADLVVDASGQGASFARRLGIARNVIDEVISIYARIPLAECNTLSERTLLEATPQGWWYLAKVPDNHCIVSLTTDKLQISTQQLTDVSHWVAAFESTQWIQHFLRKKINPTQLHQAPACSAILSACVGERWLAVGDAASSYDSITSAGIIKSLIQGKLAGDAIASWLYQPQPQKFFDYQDAVFMQFNHYIGLRHYLYQQENRFSDHGFWQRRQAIGCTAS